MDRRTFVLSSAALAVGTNLPGMALAQSAAPAPWSDGMAWSTYEVTTKVELAAASGPMRVWLPLPLSMDTDWFKTLNSSWTGNADVMKVIGDPKYGTTMFYAEWSFGHDFPSVSLSSAFQTRDRAVDLSRPRKFEPEDPATLRRYVAATEYMPTDGIIRETALKATKGAKNDLDRVRGIYDWVVENTYRKASTRGCGLGDVKAMFETGDFGGKCADLNAAFVAMARSLGIPARDVYGMRVDASKWGYRSLGTASAASGNTITGAQHCRAEVHLQSHGWVPMDPADVRKVMLEEPPGNLPASDQKVALVRNKLFGAWEMNWMAMNYAHDLKLPNGRGAPVPFLMYPNAETSAGRKDSLDPASFKYTINGRKLA